MSANSSSVVGESATLVEQLPEDAAAEVQLWEELRGTDSQQAREALFMRFLPLARRIARRTLRLHGVINIDQDDVYQSAFEGLVQALDRFDQNRGIAFATFATHRIQGAVLNALETFSEVQQQIAAGARARRQRLESLRPDDVGRSNTRDHLVETVASVSMGLAIGFMLEEPWIFSDPQAPALEPDNGYESLAWKQTQESLKQQVNTLPDVERRVLSYHYFQGMAFEQVARLLGVSKGRVSQIHKKALTQLRCRLESMQVLWATA